MVNAEANPLLVSTQTAIVSFITDFGPIAGVIVGGGIILSLSIWGALKLRKIGQKAAS